MWQGTMGGLSLLKASGLQLQETKFCPQPLSLEDPEPQMRLQPQRTP